MIVPQYRLMAWLAAVLLPGAVLGVVLPEFGPLAMLAVGLVLVVALFDLALGAGSLRGIRAELPAVVRLTHDRDGEIPVRVAKAETRDVRLRLGLPLPATVESPAEELAVVLPADRQERLFAWTCRGHRRGRYRIDRCYFERTTPLGLWVWRGSTPAATELRVYPNLASERRHLAALFLNRGGVGVHAQRQVGKGRDFEKLREYIAGDSFDDIHWKASAKRGRPVTKVFQLERTQEVYVVLDASRLSARPADAGTPGATATQFERFLVAALVLGLAAQRQGDHFGLLVFSDHVDRFVRARNGRSHYDACRDALYLLEPKLVTPDFADLTTFVRTRLTRRALLVMLTNLDDPVLAEHFVRSLRLIGRQHLILANMLVPPDVRPLFSNPDVNSVADIYRELAGHQRWHDLREVERVLKRQGVSFRLLANESLCVDLVAQYLSVKQRQLL